MTFRITVTPLNAEAEAFISTLDGGSCELRTGVQPALATDAATGTLLATITLPNPALAAGATGGVASLDSAAQTTAVADGTIGYGRFKNSVGGTIFDGSVTLDGGGGDIIATAVDLLTNGVIGIVSFTYTRS